MGSIIIFTILILLIQEHDIYLSILCVIFEFFHQYFTVFWVQVFCLLRKVTVQFSSVAQFSSVKSLSHVWLFATQQTAARQASLSITNSWITKTHAHWVNDVITPSNPVVPFSSHLQSFPATGSFQMNQFFTSHDQKLEIQLQHESFQWLFRTDFL